MDKSGFPEAEPIIEPFSDGYRISIYGRDGRWIMVETDGELLRIAAACPARIDGGREAVEEATRRIPVLSPHYDFCCDLLDAMPTEEGRSE